MAAMSESEARKILNPYENDIRECIQTGWNKYITYDPGHRAEHTSRTRANIIRDHIVAEVKKRFETKDGTYLFEQNDGLFCLNIGNKLLIKFKKFDEEKKSCNIPTTQALDFIMQFDLPGLPSLTNLIAGYENNKYQTSVECISIAHPNGSSNDWYYNLDSPMADVISMHNHTKTDDDTDQKQRVKVKDAEKIRKEENG